MNYTHEEVKAIIKFVLEEERLLDIAEEVQAIKEEFIERVGQTMPAVTAEEKEEPSAPEPKKRGPKAGGKKPKKLDHGKIMALHKGNWPVAKIADEMGCSEQAVRNHIAMEETR
jgi:predicted transcriptional regulator